MTTLQITWFFVLALLIVGYTLLDGYDLGVGIWYLFTPREEDRRTLIAAIAPFWDGNEVWVITAGGATFAAFPPVYATVFSGLYLALMLVLLALIVRGVSIEFGGKDPSPQNRVWWNLGFGLGSTLAALLFGVAVGNLLHGLPLDARGNYTGTFLSLLNPFALLVGVLNVAMLATHGALYLRLKTGGALSVTAKMWAQNAWLAYFPLTIITMLVAALTQPHLVSNYLAFPLLWALPVLTLLALLLAYVWNSRNHRKMAFLADSIGITLLLVTAVVALFPTLVPALGHPAWNLTAANASSSQLTLQVMLIITLIGMPFVLAYTIWIHRIFGGKVQGELHY